MRTGDSELDRAIVLNGFEDARKHKDIIWMERLLLAQIENATNELHLTVELLEKLGNVWPHKDLEDLEHNDEELRAYWRLFLKRMRLIYKRTKCHYSNHKGKYNND